MEKSSINAGTNKQATRGLELDDRRTQILRTGHWPVAAYSLALLPRRKMPERAAIQVGGVHDSEDKAIYRIQM